MSRLAALAMAALLASPAAPLAGGPGVHGRASSSAWHRSSSAHRSSHGQPKRDPGQRRAFVRGHPCPSTGKTSGACPGYQVDHRQALACGGADDPSNMQWLSVAEHRRKHAHGACARP